MFSSIEDMPIRQRGIANFDMYCRTRPRDKNPGGNLQDILSLCSFDSLIFADNVELMETELNEFQEIHSDKIKTFIKNLVSDGCLNKQAALASYDSVQKKITLENILFHKIGYLINFDGVYPISDKILNFNDLRQTYIIYLDNVVLERLDRVDNISKKGIYLNDFIALGILDGPNPTYNLMQDPRLKNGDVYRESTQRWQVRSNLKLEGYDDLNDNVINMLNSSGKFVLVKLSNNLKEIYPPNIDYNFYINNIYMFPDGTPYPQYTIVEHDGRRYVCINPGGSMGSTPPDPMYWKEIAFTIELPLQEAKTTVPTDIGINPETLNFEWLLFENDNEYRSFNAEFFYTGKKISKIVTRYHNHFMIDVLDTLQLSCFESPRVGTKLINHSNSDVGDLSLYAIDGTPIDILKEYWVRGGIRTNGRQNVKKFLFNENIYFKSDTGNINFNQDFTMFFYFQRKRSGQQETLFYKNNVLEIYFTSDDKFVLRVFDSSLDAYSFLNKNIIINDTNPHLCVVRFNSLTNKLHLRIDIQNEDLSLVNPIYSNTEQFYIGCSNGTDLFYGYLHSMFIAHKFIEDVFIDVLINQIEPFGYETVMFEYDDVFGNATGKKNAIKIVKEYIPIKEHVYITNIKSYRPFMFGEEFQ